MAERSRELVALVEAHPLPPRRGASGHVLDDLALASSRYAIAAERNGTSDLWRVWLAIERERGRTRGQSIDSLSPQGRRWLALWAFDQDDDDALGVDAYAAFLERPGRMAPQDTETLRYVRALSRAGRLDEALATLDRLGPRACVETCGLVAELIAAGRAPEAVDRMRAVVHVYDDSSFAWAHLALALGATGADEEMRHALRESALHEPLDPRTSMELALATLARGEHLNAWCGPEGPSRDRSWVEWRAASGERLVPSEDPSPHTFGGDLLELPDCRCGRRIRSVFVLDVREISLLHDRLPRWSLVPLLACADCVDWMLRRDFAFEGRALRLVGVHGAFQACDPTPPVAPLSTRPARLVPNLPDEQGFADWRYTQVGGVPFWVQGPRRVRCRSCREEMVFVAALASSTGFEPYVPINNDSGFQYHFACNECRTLSVLGQWT